MMTTLMICTGLMGSLTNMVDPKYTPNEVMAISPKNDPIPTERGFPVLAAKSAAAICVRSPNSAMKITPNATKNCRKAPSLALFSAMTSSFSVSEVRISRTIKSAPIRNTIPTPISSGCFGISDTKPPMVTEVMTCSKNADDAPRNTQRGVILEPMIIDENMVLSGISAKKMMINDEIMIDMSNCFLAVRRALDIVVQNCSSISTSLFIPGRLI